jgi:hypothetical protein
MNIRPTRCVAALGVLLMTVGATQAALVDRGQGFIYDTVLDITWTQNANINGLESWDNQVAWVAGYSQTHSVYGTFDDWRLPTTLQPDLTCDQQFPDGVSIGINCTGSEMGHLFNVDGISTSTPGLFTNLQPDFYWSGTEYAPDPSNTAWVFNFDTGFQDGSPKSFDPGRYALAVRDGDIAVVPIPAAAWLFSSALGLLGWLKRRVA